MKAYKLDTSVREKINQKMMLFVRFIIYAFQTKIIN